MKEEQEDGTMIEARDEQAARWFATMRRGVMSVDEQAALAAWRRDARNSIALDEMQALWDGVEAAPRVKTALPPVRPSRRAALRAAGVVLFVAAAGAGSYLALRPVPWDGEIQTAIGEQRAITLADGSLLQLNVDTVARWRLTGTLREVVIERGDADFTVAKDASRPFIVRAGTRSARAVGTEFTVALRGDAAEIAVREGVVAISRIDARARDATWAGDAATLTRGQAIQYAAVGMATTRAVPVERIGEWKARVLTYERTPLADIVRDLNRYFPGTIEIEPGALADRSVTLRLQVADRDRAIDTLATLYALSVERSAPGRVLLVARKK